VGLGCTFPVRPPRPWRRVLQLGKIAGSRPLPLVFPDAERYGKFADIRCGDGDTAQLLAEATKPVTFSRAFAAGAGGSATTLSQSSSGGGAAPASTPAADGGGADELADDLLAELDAVGGSGAAAASGSGGAPVDPRVAAALATGLITLPTQPLPSAAGGGDGDDAMGAITDRALLSTVRASGDIASHNLLLADRYMFSTPDMRAAALQARIDELVRGVEGGGVGDVCAHVKLASPVTPAFIAGQRHRGQVRRSGRHRAGGHAIRDAHRVRRHDRPGVRGRSHHGQVHHAGGHHVGG
jgi:hypothetical protein